MSSRFTRLAIIAGLTLSTLGLSQTAMAANSSAENLATLTAKTQALSHEMLVLSKEIKTLKAQKRAQHAKMTKRRAAKTSGKHHHLIGLPVTRA